MRTHRKTCYFSGRVQGVGFRAQTLSIAKDFDLCGEVRNLEDGRVLLVAEGASETLEAFEKTLAEKLAAFIERCEQKLEADVEPIYNAFKIT